MPLPTTASEFEPFLTLFSIPYNRILQPQHYPHLGPDDSLTWGAALCVHLKIFSSNPGLYPCDTNSTLPPPPVVTTKDVFRYWQTEVPPGGKTGPGWETLPSSSHRSLCNGRYLSICGQTTLGSYLEIIHGRAGGDPEAKPVVRIRSNMCSQ